MKNSEVTGSYERLKIRLAEILQDPANIKIRQDFEKLLHIVNTASGIEMDEEELVGVVAQTILLKPINQAVFPDHPFFTEKAGKKVGRLFAEFCMEKMQEEYKSDA